jgi:methionine synthase I (cobalamin-dependent)
MTRLLDALAAGRVLLMDGAMGSELQRAGMPLGACYEHWNLNRPTQVRAIHHAYKTAGAQVLLTNTFQANPAALAKHGLERQLEKIVEAGATLARSVEGATPFVLADVGPVSPDAASRHRVDWRWLECWGAALGRVDGILLETFSNHDAFAAAEFLRECGPVRDLPVLLSFAFLAGLLGLQTLAGQTPEEVAAQADRAGVAALGVNCGRDIDMTDLIAIVRRYRQATALPLFARPNAGTPVSLGGQWVYPHTPEKMAGSLPELLAAGITMLGGCCGTTPEHIAAFCPIINQWNARRAAKETSP